MAVITPKINRIVRMTEFDLLRTAKSAGNMYMCIDSQKLYYDESSTKRVIYGYKGVKTVNDLLYNITPSPNATYYCWEDNSLWLWMNKWITLWSDKTYPSAYVYDDAQNLNEVYRYDQPLLPADDNGLLKDGSVVIRDRQRIIKGKLYIDDGNDNFVISSYLGGGMRFLPNGQLDTDGELFLSDFNKHTDDASINNNPKYSFVRSEFRILNNEEYIDYSEHPEYDDNPYKKDTHQYKVFHEGNLDASLVREITPEEIYTKLLDPGLPNPFEFNVKKFDGHTPDDFAKKIHTHTASEITDFNESAKNQALVQIKQTFNTMKGEGITVSFDSASDELLMSANNFNLTFSGGVTGTGTIKHLTDTNINIVVDGSKHKHTDYIETMDNLQDQINSLAKIDPDDYYKKEVVDKKIEDITGTIEPTPGKPLLVDENGDLPTNAFTANNLSSEKIINFKGDILGKLVTDFSSDEVDVNLSAENIISDLPEPGKAVKVNADGNLPVNATSASRLDHTVQVSLLGEVTGTSEFDTSSNKLDIQTVLVPGDNILQDKDLGKRVASLGEDGIVPADQLPKPEIALEPKGYFNPNEGVPSIEPKEGNYWIANTAGDIDEIHYQINDWCLFYQNEWHRINTNVNVFSVNGKQGKILLDSEDVNAINKELIDYTLGDTIPGNKIVRTSSDGVIEGASVSNLTNEFSILSDDTGDVIISPESTKQSSNGSENFNLKLVLTESAYQNIIENAGHTISYNNSKLTHTPVLNFTSGIVASLVDTTTTDISLETGLAETGTLYWNGDTEDTNFKTKFIELYNNRLEKPFVLITNINNEQKSYLVDSTYPDLSDNLTISLSPDTSNIAGTTQDNLITLESEKQEINLTFKQTDEGTYDIDDIKVIKQNDPVLSSKIPTQEYVDNVTPKDVVKLYSGQYMIQANTECVVNHNLSTQMVSVSVYDSVTGQNINVDYRVTSENTVKLSPDLLGDHEALSVIVVIIGQPSNKQTFNFLK